MNRSADNLLIEQFRSGDNRAFEEIVRRYRDKAHGLAYHLLGNREDAEDISQEAFVIVYKKVSGFRGESSFKTWFYRIVVNLCHSHLRRRRWKNMIGYGSGNEKGDEKAIIDEMSLRTMAKDVSAEMDKVKLKNAVENAIRSLPAQQREVFVMKHFHGMKISEIAECLKCAEGTIKSHLFRAIKNLQEILRDFT
ncbi:MAG: hypothetical protein A2X87_06380 [Deltaproteobacteria bacterium GWC2_42_51]|nr:MAG: hypothetical protein A2X87_06380 [Deltaproteobacteria bacterium GWC2_42_51]OGP43799.1 MAG: hypothetical protein A2090_03050 [Deltaproteobacteria bacterium GWD2_42_10]OGP45914.1 MAG: hypothetical protein A2022_05045 [Deltaproteobacteria bacterium GWF2_42_12]OGQ29888.1 MAG: hypothetical protein A3D29_04740 [Deltaproteobacteria bacterium RIFCSPHIGHO2_02_FULL_42_44]OGQ38620.1 MAG: hypothetical protein A3H47_07905 [Deltaproteobacteria bacterium RIFCSPLOWO2_02_FULL_42_39]OGQ65194.1 MAG: hypo